MSVDLLAQVSVWFDCVMEIINETADQVMETKNA